LQGIDLFAKRIFVLKVLKLIAKACGKTGFCNKAILPYLLNTPAEYYLSLFFREMQSLQFSTPYFVVQAGSENGNSIIENEITSDYLKNCRLSIALVIG
jgi:hypothetical protein